MCRQPAECGTSRRVSGRLRGGQCRTDLRPDRQCTRMRRQLPSVGARPCQMREAWCVCSVSDIALRSDPRFSCRGSVRSLAMGATRGEGASRQHRHRPEGCQSTNRSPCAPGLFRTEGCVCRLSPGDSSAAGRRVECESAPWSQRVQLDWSRGSRPSGSLASTELPSLSRSTNTTTLVPPSFAWLGNRIPVWPWASTMSPSTQVGGSM